MLFIDFPSLIVLVVNKHNKHPLEFVRNCFKPCTCILYLAHNVTSTSSWLILRNSAYLSKAFLTSKVKYDSKK